ncbi:MAG: nitroreductase [Thermoleophilia bacterium]|nr:nitroreductase [Thermoleophilia bacterium]
MQAWAVSDADFPKDGDPESTLRFLLRYAILAPSGHNTQPWLFAVGDGAIGLYADRTRALPVVDPDDRELTISCGAALETLLVAMRHFGHRGTVWLAPDPDDEDLLARVALGDGEPPGRDEEELFGGIPRRHSNRQAFEDRDIPGVLADRLVADAEMHGAWLCLVRGDGRAAVADLVAEGDRAQMADKRFRRELAAWVHPNRSRSHDGMRGYGFGFGDLMSHGGPLAIRAFDLGKGQAAKDRELAQGSPLLAVLGTAADDPASWLRSGRALQRVLLRARTNDVWSSYLNQPIEVDALRPRLADVIGRAGQFPQLIVRLGYGVEVKPQPRRPLEAVILGAEAGGQP